VRESVLSCRYPRYAAGDGMATSDRAKKPRNGARIALAHVGGTIHVASRSVRHSGVRLATAQRRVWFNDYQEPGPRFA